MFLLGRFYGFLGYVNHLRSYPKRAEKYYAKAMKAGGMAPRYAGAYGVLLMKQGKFAEAVKLYDRALSSKSMKKDLRPLILMNRAIAWFKTGEADKAISALESLHRTFKSRRVYETLGYIYVAAGMYEKAEPYNLEACEYDSEDPVVMDNTGQMYLEMGQIEKAKGYFERAYAKKHISDVLFHMGLIAEHENRPQDALAYYREAMTKNMDALNDVTPEKLRGKIDALREQLGITEEEDEI